jgi:UDP-glucose 4-epimerase
MSGAHGVRTVVFHVTDLAQAHMLGLHNLQSGAPSDAFNLGNGSGFSVREVIAAVERVTGRPVRSVTAPRRPGDPPVLVGSASKARQVLGWTQKLDMLDAIIETAWTWHKRSASPRSSVSPMRSSSRLLPSIER